MTSQKTFAAIAVFCALAVASILPFPSSAQEAAKDAAPEAEVRRVKVAIIDLEEIALKSVAVQDIRRQVEAYAADFRQKFQAEEEDLRKAQDELAKQRTILSQEAFASESKKFQARVVESQRNMQSKREALAQVQGEAMLKVLKARDEAIKNVVTERAIALVLRSEAVVVNIPQMNITDDVLTKLNAKLASVPVTSPDKVSPAAGK